MKKSILLITLFSLLAVLSGCACEHEWTEADCLNPQTCTKCDEIGEAALGHDWAAASCSAPETCTRCSQIQGQALEHSYGDWSFHKDQMSHECADCGFVKTAPIDRELYLEKVLTGHWDMLELHDGEHVHSAMDVLLGGDDHNCYIVFGEDRSCQIVMRFVRGKPTLTGTWELAEYDDSKDAEMYYIYVHLEDQQVVIILHVSPDGEMKISFEGANFVLYFYQEGADILETVCTNWGLAPDENSDRSYYFQFRPDRTVTCNVEGKFEGTWSLYPTPGYDNWVAVHIEYVRDGKDETFVASIQLSGKDISVPTMYLKNGNSSIMFHQVSDDEFSLIQNATNILRRGWTSVGDFPNPEYATELITEYSLTFLENGSFTMSHEDGRTYTGKWSVKSFSPDGTLYQYLLYFEAQKANVHCYLRAYDEPYFMEIYRYVGDDYQNLYFTQRSEDTSE